MFNQFLLENNIYFIKVDLTTIIMKLIFQKLHCKETKSDLMDSNNKMLYMDASPHFSSENPEPLLDEGKLFKKKIQYFLVLENIYC